MTQLMMDHDHCDVCSTPIKATCIDGRTTTGQWALMCPACHKRIGAGLGTGRGQKYTKRADGTFWKEGTGPIEIADRVKPSTVVDRAGVIDLRRLNGQCDPVKDRDMLKRELGLTDAEIDTIVPAKPPLDDDPWFA